MEQFLIFWIKPSSIEVHIVMDGKSFPMVGFCVFDDYPYPYSEDIAHHPENFFYVEKALKL